MPAPRNRKHPPRSHPALDGGVRATSAEDRAAADRHHNQSVTQWGQVFGDDVITYGNDGKPALRIPLGEARLCVLYRNPETSETSGESYAFSELLGSCPSRRAAIFCNGSILAFSPSGDRWEITPSGQDRLLWEASLLKSRWEQR